MWFIVRLSASQPLVDRKWPIADANELTEDNEMTFNLQIILE